MTLPSYAVVNDLPAPLTTGSTTQGFVDLFGEQWVAKNGVNNGAWRKARDVLHAVIYRNTALAMPAALTQIAYDTTLRDTYGMFTAGGGLTVPVAGWYFVQAVCNTNVNVAASYVTCTIYQGATQAILENATNPLAGGGFSARVWGDLYCAALDVITGRFALFVSTSQNLQLGQSNARLEVSYLGTG